MFLSGVQPFTLLDYPEHTACIAFTPGCNMRCGFCHNPEFVLPEMLIKIKDTFITEEAFLRFLDSRVGMLDGVVISGGEPTVQVDLLPFLEHIKEKGFLVKLDTNGNKPEVIEQAIDQSLVDYIAMDVKTSLENYTELTGKLTKTQNIQTSIDLLKQNRVPYEFRSTLIQEIHTPKILTKMSELMSGAQQLFLQTFRSEQTLNPDFTKYHSFSDEELRSIAQNYFSPNIASVHIR